MSKKTKKKERRRRIGIGRRVVTREQFREIAKTKLYPNDLDDVMTAYSLAEMGHRGELRHDNMDYFEHCKFVALIIMQEFWVYKPQPICGGLLHDFNEGKYRLSWRALHKFFGNAIYRCVRIITKERGKDYYLEIKNVAKRDWGIILTKLADRLHNMRNILHEPKKFMLTQLKETEAMYPDLLTALEEKVPKEFAYLPQYISEELEYACNRVRRKFSMPSSRAFKRVK